MQSRSFAVMTLNIGLDMPFNNVQDWKEIWGKAEALRT
jgi:hypothetical protein